jgi:uncharacterized protein (TIGR01777 family)
MLINGVVMATIFITGGTGLIGTAVIEQWLKDGHQLIVQSRYPHRVEQQFGDKVTAVSAITKVTQPIDGILNLAGEPIADARWTQTRKQALFDSRVSLTEQLIAGLKQNNLKPQWMISGSAVGWYGNQYGRVLTETSGYEDEFAHRLCNAWEQAARQAEDLGIRLCLLRTGLVLAPKGGFLKRMLLPFKLGLGGRIGDGQQYMPWVHLDDMVRLIEFLRSNDTLSGVFNATAPNPVTNAEFSKALARQLKRPACFPLPAPLLKLGFGEMAELLLHGQRAIPEKATTAGFKFDYTDVDLALNKVLQRNHHD